MHCHGLGVYLYQFTQDITNLNKMAAFFPIWPPLVSACGIRDVFTPSHIFIQMMSVMENWYEKCSLPTLRYLVKTAQKQCKYCSIFYLFYFTNSVILLYWQSRRQCAVQRISVLWCLQFFASLILHSQNYVEVIYNLETASGSILKLLFSCFIFLLVVVTQKWKFRIIQHLSPNMTSLINSVLEVLR